MGFCLGHEIISVAYRGRIKKYPEYLNRKDKVRILEANDPIFEGLNKNEITLHKRHHYYVSELPPDFINLAESDTFPFEIIRHKTKPIYGFQSHPEVSGADGLLMVSNFIKMCGLEIK